MNAINLQDRLAQLVPGETLLVPAVEIERAFRSYPTSEERRAAAANLAEWYQCQLTICGPGGSQILFTRPAEPSTANYA